MEDPVKKVAAFIEQENCFAVLGQLRRLGVLSKDDIRRAMGMRRSEFIVFMKEKAGIAGAENDAEGEGNVE
ncbi:MAG TPA: hypothetical protein PLS19_09130 [bacterium]|nr:hypothetical protein [bacterium]HPN94710.1 hypothetical protein [bacterium]